MSSLSPHKNVSKCCEPVQAQLDRTPSFPLLDMQTQTFLLLLAGKKSVQVHTSPIYFQLRKRIGHSGVLETHQELGIVCDTHNIFYFPAFNNEGKTTDRIIWLASNIPPSFDLSSKRRSSVMAWTLKSGRLQTVYSDFRKLDYIWIVEVRYNWFMSDFKPESP